MSKTHPDSTAIDRVGGDVVQSHFALTRQTLWNWRTKGVPRQMRKPLRLLGETQGHDMRDFETSAE